MKNIVAFLFLMASPLLLTAQDQVPMADGMRSEGKIYVVVAIILVILLGLFGYLFLLDRKVSNIERK